jgi:hypothetical protein
MLAAIFALQETLVRAILFSLVLAATAACSARDGAEAPAAADSAVANASEQGSAKTIEEMRAQSLAEIDRAACEGAGGEVRQVGMLGMWRCVKPYADAGKPCRGDADCEGKCLAAADVGTGAGDIKGECQADDSPFGCFTEVEDGKVASAVCVD